MAALIGQYLRQDPEEDFERFINQAAKALWLEERYFKNMAQFFKVK
jgi:hypothetical protein